MITIVTPPEPLVSLEDVKVALGDSGTDRDTLITALILAAQGELDGPNGWVGISVAEQTAQMTFPSFATPLRLIGGPVLSATIEYIDGEGASTEVGEGVFRIMPNGTLVLVDGEQWPETKEPVLVTYEVGIPPAEEGASDPRIEQMRVAIMMHVRMTLDMVETAVHRRAIEALVRPMWVHP